MARRTSGFLVLLVWFLPTWCFACAATDEKNKADEERVVTAADKHDGKTVKLTVGKVLVLKLKVQPGTGYTYQIVKQPKEVLKQVGQATFVPLEKAKPGGTELQVFRFKVLGKGKATLELHYRRPWEPKDKPPEKKYRLEVEVDCAS
jgi:inhibitor of cysteine peptidase